MTTRTKTIQKAGKSPCFQCEDRKVGCHSKCNKYKFWKVLRDKEKQGYAINKSKLDRSPLKRWYDSESMFRSKDRESLTRVYKQKKGLK